MEELLYQGLERRQQSPPSLLHRQLRLLMTALLANLTSGLMTKAIVSGVNNDIISDFKEIRDGLQAIRGLQV
jgi:hypothetical protein